MSLLDTVEQDNAFLLEDDVLGFARPVTLTDPEGPTVYSVKGLVNRIAVETDPGTGVQIPANKASVTVRLASIANKRPGPLWTISTTDVTGAVLIGKIPKTGDNVFPDRTLGRVTIIFKVED